MTIKLFEEPVEAAQSAQLDVPIVTRILSAGLASLVAILPAGTAALTAYRITNFYASMTNAEQASTANFTSNLHFLNTPMVVALGLSALLAFVIALLVAVYPKLRLAIVGLPFSIAIPFLAALPAMMLWSAETTTLEVMAGRLNGGSVAEVAQKIGLLLLGTMVWGSLAAAITLACSVVSLLFPVRRRTDALSLRRAFVWAVTGMLLLAFAGAYFVVV